MTEQERNEVVERARLALANAKGAPNPNWDESKHPRGAGGRFGHGSGGAKAGDEEEADKVGTVYERTTVRNAAPAKKNKEDKAAQICKTHDETVAYYGGVDHLPSSDNPEVDYYERCASKINRFGQELLAGYPIPVKKGDARDKAIAERNTLLQKTAKHLGVYDPDMWDYDEEVFKMLYE